MVVTRNEGIQAKLEYKGEHQDQVEDFKFLGGSYKSADGDCTNEIKSSGSSEGSWTDYHLEGQKRHVCVEKNQSDEVDGLAVFQYGMEG